MPETLAAQLEQLHRERARLEELLTVDGNWRALAQLEARERYGEPVAAEDGAGLKASLRAALGDNRVFEARARVLKAIEELSEQRIDGRNPHAGDGSTNGASNARVPSVASRIVMLSQPGAETFRTKLRVKQLPNGLPAAPTSKFMPPHKSFFDALELIDGLGRSAVELLLSHGVQSYAAIAHWTSADVAMWSARLEGLAVGPPISWIEQAAVLASGRQTAYAARARSGDFASLTASPAAEAVAHSNPPARQTELDQNLAAAVAVPAGAGPGQPAERSVDGTQLVSAEELIRVLGKTQSTTHAAPPASPPCDLKSASNGAHRAGPNSGLQPQGLGYVRPRSVAAADGTDTAIVASTPPPRAATVDKRETGAGLLRRLKRAGQPDRFEAGAYAAYRTAVEEASVTIVRHQDDSRSAAMKAGAPPVEPPPVAKDRFLKALIGKR